MSNVCVFSNIIKFYLFFFSTYFVQIVFSLCMQSYLLMADSISKGIEQGLSECQHQFRWDRWDCTDRNIMQVVHSSRTEGEI